MLRNYVTIAWRNLAKTKGYSFINIGGLALGMAVALIIGLWVNDELTFNKYHDNYGQVAGRAGHESRHFSGKILFRSRLSAVPDAP
jgi:putative ABC transport system permease protein